MVEMLVRYDWHRSVMEALCFQQAIAPMAKQKTDPRSHSYVRNALAIAALEQARKLAPGTDRIEALRNAGRLRYEADSKGVIFAKRGRPRK